MQGMATHDNYERARTHTPCLPAVLSFSLFRLFFPILISFTSSFDFFSFNPFISPLPLPPAVISACSHPVSERGGREAAVILMMHMNMKGKERKKRRGVTGPRKGYEAFTAYASPCTSVYLHSFIHAYKTCSHCH